MNSEYSHIDTIYKRHMDGPQKGRLIEGDFSRPEFAYLAGNKWVGTEKVDGTNIRVMFRPGGLGAEYGGKTDNAQIPAPLVSRLREIFDPIRGPFLYEEYFPKAAGNADITLYGEGYGAKIQKGGGNYKPDGVDFVLFDVKVGDWWLQREGIEDVTENLGLRVVPIVFEGTLMDACKMAGGGYASTFGPTAFSAEGLVLKPAVDLICRNGDRLITKIKQRDFR